MKEDNIVQW